MGACMAAGDTGSRVLGSISSVEDLRRLLHERAEQVGVSRVGLDELAGISSGLTSKVLAAHGDRRLSLFNAPLIAAALGCSIQLVVDEEVCERMRDR
jgi:hypothetical protein